MSNELPERPPRQPKKWTVMVYMDAHNDQQLDGHALRDLREMERVTNDAINVVAQVHREWPSRPQRYDVGRGTSKLVSLEFRDSGKGTIDDEDARTISVADVGPNGMGDAWTLASFLLWALEARPADRYFLVLWGHAYGLGFGRDHETQLSLKQLNAALQVFQVARTLPDAVGDKPKLELLGANACAMSYAEAAFELKDNVQFLVASQLAVPFTGWPYESILKQIGQGTGPEKLGETVVNSYVNHFNASSGGGRVSMSLLNLARADTLQCHFRDLANALSAATKPGVTFDSNRLTHLRTAFLATAGGEVRPLIDLSDLCDELASLCDDLDTLEGENPEKKATVAKLREAAKAMHACVEPMDDVVETFPPASPGGKELRSSGLVVLHRRHQELDGLHGLGIFAPFVTDERALERLGLLSAPPQPRVTPRQPSKGEELYKELGLIKDTPWADLVYHRLHQELSPDIVSDAAESGASTRSDKEGVVQILVAVDSMFNKFDRTLAVAKHRIVGGFPNDDDKDRHKKQYPAGFPADPALVENAFESLRLFQRPKRDPNAVPNVNGITRFNPLPRTMHDDWVEPLVKLETALGEIEKTTRRALTHPTLGLGPPPDGKPGFGLAKAFLGGGHEKPSFLGGGHEKPSFLGGGHEKPSFLGGGHEKPSFLGGGHEKPSFLGPGNGVGLDELSTLLTSFSVGSGAALGTAMLFAQVGQSMLEIEGATALTESTLAQALSGEPARANGNGHRDNRERVGRAFRAIEEASSAARRTMRRALTHPLYGIGPGLQDLDPDDRRELADLGGLSGRQLVLL